MGLVPPDPINRWLFENRYNRSGCNMTNSYKRLLLTIQAQLHISL